MISAFPASLTPAKMYRRYAETPGEIDVELRASAGVAPAALRGVLLRNGPGRVTAHGRAYDHPFDGDGMLHGFYFDGGHVRYRNRWVRTKEFLAEERAGRAIYRNFGTNLPGGTAGNILRTRFKNPANTSVIFHAGRTLALWEGGLPHEVDLGTLETRGRYDFDGVLDRPLGAVDRFLSPETPFAAHTKVDARTGELFGFGLARGVRPKLLVYRVSKEGRMDPPRSVRLESLSYVHDFAMTDRHLVFVMLPMSFDTTKMLLGRATPVASLELRGDEATVVVVPRDGGPVTRFRTPSLFAFHHVNAWDEGDEIVIDSIVMETPPPLAEMHRVFSGDHDYPDPRLTRLRIDPRRAVMRRETVLARPIEFATVRAADVGRPGGIAYALGSAEGLDRGAVWHSMKTSRSPAFTGIARIELATGHAHFADMGHDFPSEPVHVACDGGGVVLVVVYRTKTHRSELRILADDDLRQLAVMPIPQHIPPGLHGCFVSP